MVQEQRLKLPEPFMKACELFAIHPLEALQFFISKNTLYAFLVKLEDTPHSLASIIFDEWLESKGAINGKMDDYKRLAGIRFVKRLLRLMSSNRNNPEKKNVAYKRLISQWYAAIKPHLPPKTVETTSNLTVLLTKDFCILCDLFRGTPLELLQFFVNRVSVPAYFKTEIQADFIHATGFFMQYDRIRRQANDN